MYLKQLHIENNGPLREVHLELPFTQAGTPKPVVLVGANGSGKTNLLSIVADALFTAAARHYTDVMPGISPISHPFFRVVGPMTTTTGASGNFTVMEFEHENATYLFKEKSGRVTSADVKAHLPQNLHVAVSWTDDDKTTMKEFAISDDPARTIFMTGVYVYFPSSRAEVPHWLNLESLPTADFDFQPRFSTELRKPIFVEKALERFQRWLLSVILEIAVGPPAQAHARQNLALANNILERLLGITGVRFSWLGRQNTNKLGVVTSDGQLIVPMLRGLSAGQSTLLGIIGTVLSYGDHGRVGAPLLANEITGICLIDEIDAHMHIDLQYRALPELLELFPKVQFIVSSHSPLFVLGMQRTFGAGGIAIVDMPSGTPIEAEAYAEFGHALQVFASTKSFAAAMEAAVAATGKALVLLEGETDPIYLQTAADLLGRTELLDRVEFEWVGAKDPQSGQGFHSGRSGLDKTFTVLRAKPQLIQRPVLLFYDNDTNKPVMDEGFVHVRTMPSNLTNATIDSGIENLLPSLSICDRMFDVKTEQKRNGTFITIKELNKMRLCTHICQDKRDPADFENFYPVLEMIEAIVNPPAHPTPADAGAAETPGPDEATPSA